MANKNDSKTSPQSSSSTVKGLFRQASSETSPAAEQDTPTPANAEEKPEQPAKEGFSARLKTGWQTLINALKQQPKAEEEEEPEEEPLPAEEASAEESPEATAAVDWHSVRESYKTPSRKPAPEKEEEKEKRRFSQRFKLERIEEEEEQTVSAPTAKDVSATPVSPDNSTDSADTKQPSAENGQPDSPTASEQEEDTIVFATGKPVRTTVTRQASSPEGAASLPKTEKPVPPATESRAFSSVFQDFTEPPKDGMTDRPAPSAEAADAKAPQEVRIPSAVRQSESKKPVPPPIPPQKPPAAPSPSEKNPLPEAAPSVISANDTAWLRERSTENQIYNATKREPEPIDIPEEQDFTEGSLSSVTYHYSNAVPFIIMTGKFTKTLRDEYEAVRKYRREHTPPPAPTAAPAVPAEKEKTTAAAVVQAVTAAGQGAKAVSPPSQSKMQEPQKSKKKTKQTPLSKLAQYDEISEEPDTEPDKKTKKRLSKAERQSAAKERRTRKKFRFRDLFSSEEEFDLDEEAVKREEEVRPPIEDYNEEKEAEAIQTDISSNFQAVFVRTLILLAASAASVTASLLAQCSPLFRENIRNGWLWFALISFLFFAVSVIVSRGPIVNGLMPLRRFKGNADTAVAVASVAVAIQSVTALLTPDLYLSGTLHLYTPLVILALFCNAVGKLLMITRTHYNFRFLTKPYPKYAGKIFTDKQNAQRMVKELPMRKPLIGYTRRARFMSNFLQLSYAPDPSEKMAMRTAPYTTVLSVVCGLLFGIVKQSFLGGLAAFALTACMSVPIISLIAVNLPLRRLCKASLHSGAMITGYETVRQFCDTNAIMIDSSQLYPKGSVTLSGMRSFKQSKLKDALQAGAAIMYAVNGTMIHVFENIVQCSKENLPRVDNVIYEDGKGLVGWISEQRILIGNRALLKAHNVEPPDQEIEDKYLARGEDVMYISVSGELIAMFMLSYKTNKHIANALKNLEQSGVNFVIRTVDPNLTREKVAERFGLFYRCITVLPTGLGNICHDVMSQTDDKARAYLVTRGKLSSFAQAVYGCIKIKAGINVSKILQCIALAAGLLLVVLISFVSGFEKLGCFEMLIYIGFWSVTAIITSLIKK